MEKRYSMKDMEETFGVARTTVIYYEKLGILKPKRQDGNGYRVFTTKDVFRLMESTILKNIGVPIKDHALYLDGNLDDDQVEELLRISSERKERADALNEGFERVVRAKRRAGTLSLENVEAYYATWDSAEKGYLNFNGSTNLDRLIENLPISGMGSIWEESPFKRNVGRWCRTVPVARAHLLDDFTGQDSLGGCRCLVAYTFWTDIYDEVDDRDIWRTRVEDFLAAKGLEAAGSAFSPFCAPSDHGYYVPVCIPVRPRG